ncbi:MAG: hypothetical protein VW270_13315, partial [Candidatus Poseidoniales archaeon]
MKNNKQFGLTDSLLDAVRQVVEKKLDPVGQADADIDNDGDVDSSDKYLHRRRKAIKKAMAKEHKGDKPHKHPHEGVNEGYEDAVMKVLSKKRIDGRFDKGDLYVDKRSVSAAKAALKRDFSIKSLPKIIGEEV